MILYGYDYSSSVTFLSLMVMASRTWKRIFPISTSLPACSKCGRLSWCGPLSRNHVSFVLALADVPSQMKNRPVSSSNSTRACSAEMAVSTVTTFSSPLCVIICTQHNTHHNKTRCQGVVEGCATAKRCLGIQQLVFTILHCFAATVLGVLRQLHGQRLQSSTQLVLLLRRLTAALARDIIDDLLGPPAPATQWPPNCVDCSKRKARGCGL